MEKYIKSPLNYTGGKFKLLPKILPLFPKEIDRFVDLFCGGCNVAVNVNARQKICNDIEWHVVDLFNFFKSKEASAVCDEIDAIIEKYNLTNTTINGYEYYGTNSSDGVGKYNKDKYIMLRNDYNKDTSNSIMFFATVIFSFCNQIRYNSKGEFNVAVNKRDFNENMRKNTIKFINTLDESFCFIDKDFREIKVDKLNNNDFVYCDPPYLITTANYNENGGWTEKDEYDLLSLLDKLNNSGVRFALSNVLTHKGKTNDILIEWAEKNKDKYIVHHLDHAYSNCNYHDKTGTSGISDEVLICNY